MERRSYIFETCFNLRKKFNLIHVLLLGNEMIDRPVIDGIIANRTIGVSTISFIFVKIFLLAEVIVPGLLQVGKLLFIGMILSLVIFGGVAGVLAFSYGYLRLWSWLLKFFHFD
jgi:hypothetical protein